MEGMLDVMRSQVYTGVLSGLSVHAESNINLME